MKINRYMSLLLVMFIIIGFSGCAGKPDVQFDKEFYELGELNEGIKTEIVFSFTNTGKGPLVIRDVKPACGCTVVTTWDKEVAPGAIGKIPVTFNTTGYKGDIIRLIDVTTNVPEKPIVQLTLKAQIRIPLVEIAPSKLWLAEISPELKQLYGSFELKSQLDSPFKIEKVIAPADIKNTYTLNVVEKDKIYRLDFIVYAPFEGSGNVEKNFTLKTNLKDKPEIVLPFFYYKKP